MREVVRSEILSLRQRSLEVNADETRQHRCAFQHVDRCVHCQAYELESF